MTQVAYKFCFGKQDLIPVHLFLRTTGERVGWLVFLWFNNSTLAMLCGSWILRTRNNAPTHLSLFLLPSFTQQSDKLHALALCYENIVYILFYFIILFFLTTAQHCTDINMHHRNMKTFIFISSAQDVFKTKAFPNVNRTNQHVFYF